MARGRRDWPLTAEQLIGTIAVGETTLVEFKREWWNLSAREGQAKLARQVMALANTVGPEELGLVIFGVEDERRGGGIVPVVDAPEPEAITQILAGYVHPAARIECKHFDLEAGRVSGLAVLHAPTRPHYCIREYSEILSTRDVYVRRDKQVGVLTMPELELMIREKDSFAGAQRILDPIEFGFVTFDANYAQNIVLRVRNLTTDPIADVSVIIDFRQVRDPTLFCRARVLLNATLSPGEAQEIPYSLRSVEFYKPFWKGDPPTRQMVRVEQQNYVGDRWLTVEATLVFRGTDGLLHTRQISIPLEA